MPADFPLRFFPTLPSAIFLFYTGTMDDLSVGLILVLGTIITCTIGIRWWRYRRAGKLADKLLDEVIKGKDAFRR